MADSMDHCAPGEPDHRNIRGGRRSKSPGPRPTRRILHPPLYPRTTPYAIPRVCVHPPLSSLQGAVNRVAMASGVECGTMLYISNLDYRVSEDDIKVLFSYVGELKSCALHFDKSGRSKGTGEVVFLSRSDALMAIKRYNNVPLDGKPIKIEEVGVINHATQALPLKPPVVVLEKPRRSFECVPPRRSAGNYARENERFSRVAAGYGSRPKLSSGHESLKEISHQKQVTAAELDADLERYRLEAKKD